MTTRAPILPESPAHADRLRWRCLTRKVVTAWAPFYANVDFDHEANPVRVHISQPGKKMGTEFGAAVDCISRACSQAIAAGVGYVAIEYRNERGDLVPIDIITVSDKGADGTLNTFGIDWMQRREDITVQDMLRQLEGAITGLIQEARAG